MDRLALLDSIAGVTAAGLHLSKAIYDVVENFRDANPPREVSDIARGISDLTRAMSELRWAIKDGGEMC
jgi:hypothetical protein